MFLITLAVGGAWTVPGTARAGAEPFIGELMLFGGNFCPRGWADASGQLLAVSQNEALFSLLGTMYGGDGRTTFGLPDLRGRVPLHAGQGPGLTNRHQGSRGGQETVTLSVTQMPSHSHALVGTSDLATQLVPQSNLLASKERIRKYRSPAEGADLVDLSETSVGSTGNSQAHDNMPPYLTLRWCIALQGVYPSRN
jgi:microcystin-dependent protein